MINTIIFIAIALLCGFGIGVFYSFRKKKKFKETEPDYEALYREAASRLKIMVSESNTQYSMQGSMTEQLVWHKNLVEQFVKTYSITDDQLYDIIKNTNDSMGLPTPTKEEMEQQAEQVIRMIGTEEQLKEYSEAKNNKKKIVELNLDSILDKVSQSGMDSLTEAEREFLNKQ